MYYFLFFVLGLVVAFGIWKVMQKVQGNNLSVPPEAGHLPSAGEKGALMNAEQIKQHQENLAKIVSELQGKGQATNMDIQKLLGVTDTTVVRYMNELEKDGKVEQVGKTPARPCIIS